MTDLCDHREGRPASPNALAEEREGANLPCRPDAKEEAQPAPISPFRAVLQKLGRVSCPWERCTPQLPLSRLLRSFPGHGWHGARAAQRHAEPRHDRGTLGASLASGADKMYSNIPGAPRLRIRYASIAAWVEARALYLVGRSAVGRPRHRAVGLCCFPATHKGPPILGNLAVALAFLLVGAGLHTTQTAGWLLRLIWRLKTNVPVWSRSFMSCCSCP